MNKSTLKRLAKRFVTMIPMLFVISALVFFALQLTPGDPLAYQISPELLASGSFDMEAYKKAMGLDVPVYIQYFRWLGNMLRGDFGYSLVSGTPISYMLGHRLPATLELIVCALILSSIFGLLFGLLAAVRQNTVIDYGCTALSILAISIPEFFLGILGINLFSLQLGWLPTGGRMVYGVADFIGRFPNLVMPAVTLGLTLTGALMRYTRGSMLDVMSMDYIKTARSKGIPEWKVYMKHAFRNALMPITVLLCFRLPILVGGAVVTESVFAWPGMGGMLLDAISGKDYPVVMITAMIIAVMTLIASFLVDMLTAILDPRVNMD